MERLDVELKSPPFVSGLSVSFVRRLLRFRCLLGQGQGEGCIQAQWAHSHWGALLMMTSQRPRAATTLVA
jgi:hypothetical protein